MNHESPPNPGIRRNGSGGRGLCAPNLALGESAHCSAGISIRAYFLWLLASLLFSVHAAMIKDIVFILVQVVNLMAIAAVVVYAKRYETQICLLHLEKYRKQLQQQEKQEP